MRIYGGCQTLPDIPDNALAGCPGTSSAEAGKKDSCQGCPNQSACASGSAIGPDSDKLEANLRMEKVNYKLLVLSGKGGVGKSTLATQLAMALSANGDLTGLLDIDICGPSIPRMVGVEGEEVRQALNTELSVPFTIYPGYISNKCVLLGTSGCIWLATCLG